MIDRNETDKIIKQLCDGIYPLFPDSKLEVFLFGSYARGDAEDGSDIDLMLLVDYSREDIAKKNRIDRDLTEQIVRLYVTHPGVTTDGIMTKLGLLGKL